MAPVQVSGPVLTVRRSDPAEGGLVLGAGEPLVEHRAEQRLLTDGCHAYRSNIDPCTTLVCHHNNGVSDWG